MNDGLTEDLSAPLANAKEATNTYRVVYEKVVEAADEEDAATIAVELIMMEGGEPSLIEEMS